VVPSSTPTVAMLEEARRRCIALDWRLEDVVVIPVDELSPIVDTRSEEHADT
jgi:hypothetical protein